MRPLPDLQTEERRPLAEAPSRTTTTTVVSSSPQSTDLAARARRHDFAVRVVSERADGVLVAQFYTNLPAAERKLARTQERGLRAEMHLVRIVPVGVTPLPAVASTAMLAELLGVGR